MITRKNRCSGGPGSNGLSVLSGRFIPRLCLPKQTLPSIMDGTWDIPLTKQVPLAIRFGND
jgi:hypothetical protein